MDGSSQKGVTIEKDNTVVSATSNKTISPTGSAGVQHQQTSANNNKEDKVND